MKKQKQKEENKVEYGTVSLPLPLVKIIKKRIKGTGFSSVSSYVTFILRQILASEDMTIEELNQVRERLKKLGYL